MLQGEITMKILVYYKKSDNSVLRVDGREKYENKTEAEIEEAVMEHNSHDEYSNRIEYIEVPESISEVISFLLGETKYKTTWTIHNLIEQLDDFSDTLSNIEDDISHCRWNVEKLVEEGRKIIKPEEEED